MLILYLSVSSLGSGVTAAVTSHTWVFIAYVNKGDGQSIETPHTVRERDIALPVTQL